MEHFWGSIQGSRGKVTRLGTKRSGLTVEAQGWDIGARVEVEHDNQVEADAVAVWITRGSNDNGEPVFLGRFWLDSAGNIVRYSTIDGDTKVVSINGEPV